MILEGDVMRNRVSGIIGVLFGSIWTMRALVSPPGSDGTSGAYATGQFAAAVFGVVFLAAGIYYLRRDRSERG